MTHLLAYHHGHVAKAAVRLDIPVVVLETRVVPCLVVLSELERRAFKTPQPFVRLFRPCVQGRANAIFAPTSYFKKAKVLRWPYPITSVQHDVLFKGHTQWLMQRRLRMPCKIQWGNNLQLSPKSVKKKAHAASHS